MSLYVALAAAIFSTFAVVGATRVVAVKVSRRSEEGRRALKPELRALFEHYGWR
jgi:hypothetical protein